MNHRYRNDASAALARAKAELSNEDDARLRHAALELRLALEALVYDRAQMYRKEISPSECAVWQPGKLLKVLMEIEPLVDQSVSIRMQRQATETTPASEWLELGEDRVIPMKVVHRHHNALGSWLHTPTMDQLSRPESMDAAGFRTRCTKIISDIELALASDLQTNFGSFVSFECVKCSATVRRRVHSDGEVVIARCHGSGRENDCGAEYEVMEEPDGGWSVLSCRSSINCPSNVCGHLFRVWTSEVKHGAKWVCPMCSCEIKVDFKVSRA